MKGSSAIYCKILGQYAFRAKLFVMKLSRALSENITN